MLARADVERLREARPSDSFDLLSPMRWEGKTPPRRDWLVEKCFVRGSVMLLTGPGGAGKSLLMQQLLTSAVLGWPFLGLACQPGRALFFGAEDDQDELWRRQHDINRAAGLTMTDIAEAGLWLAPRVGFDNTLSRLDKKEWRMQPTTLFERLLHSAWTRGLPTSSSIPRRRPLAAIRTTSSRWCSSSTSCAGSPWRSRAPSSW